MKFIMIFRMIRLMYLISAAFSPILYEFVRSEPAREKPLNLVGDHLSSVNKPKTRIVSTKYGDLRGFITTLPNRLLQSVEVFLGIPYASPPISALRFMPPVTPAHWKGVKTADRFSPVCPQKPPDIKNETEALKIMPAGRLEYLKRLLPYLQNQSEDCLYLNIYAPSRSAKDKTRVPVLVFIHGESYEWNAGNPYDGSVLASFGKVVVVTVNYRLGVLGFLPVMEGTARGNYGLTDQVAALHWIQENIAEFGGDPQNVTIFGQGHGAACVNFLVLSPMSKGSSLFPAGLFHRAIMMSGSALSSWAIARDANLYAQQIARTLGCPIGQPAALIECLRQRSVSDILRVQVTVPMFLTGFGPTIDGIVIQNEPTAMMEELADDEKLGVFDLMFGVTKVESYFYISEKEEKSGFEIDRRDKLLRTLVRNIFDYHLQEIFLTIVNEYTDWSKTVQHDLNILDGTLDALGDALVVAPIVKSANYYSMSKKNAFFYVFNYQKEDGKYPIRQGCISGEDLQYVFGAPFIGSLGHYSENYTSNEVALSEAVIKYWVNFARNGDPNNPPDKASPERKGRYDKVIWPVYEAVHQRYMMIGTKPRIRDHYHAHRLSFWLHLFPQLHASGSANVDPEHHLLDDHDNLQSYEGAVRELPFTLSRYSNKQPTVSSLVSNTTFNSLKAKTNILFSTLQLNLPTTTDISTFSTTTMNGSIQGAKNAKDASRSEALVITIAVGLSFVLLNGLIFCGIYYQSDRTRNDVEAHKRLYAQRALDSQLSTSVGQVKTLTLRAPPPSPVCTTVQQQQELALHTQPTQHLNNPHKVPPKPCAVPTPPQIAQKESLVEVQPLLNQAGSNALSSKTQGHQHSQNAQVHHQRNHSEIKL